MAVPTPESLAMNCEMKCDMCKESVNYGDDYRTHLQFAHSVTNNFPFFGSAQKGVDDTKSVMTPAGRMNRSKQHNIRTEAHFVQSLPEGCSELDSVLRCSNYLPSWHPHKCHLELRDILGSGISATFWDMKESGSNQAGRGAGPRTGDEFFAQ